MKLAVTRDPWRVRPERPELAGGPQFSPGHVYPVGGDFGCELFVKAATPNRPAPVVAVSGRCSSSSEAQQKKVWLARRR